MHELLGQTIKNLRVQITEKNAVVTNEELPIITVDSGQIVQLLQNLIANALKFCKRPPRIHISVKEEENYHIFSVKDNGIGIETAYFEKIFQIFQRLHLKEEYHGTGIGLSICRRIVERHGGKIWVETSSKQGTTFSFSIQKDPIDN
jgi:light-regulated signal transduction histidine kinase (bacteriophytochrome)